MQIWRGSTNVMHAHAPKALVVEYVHMSTFTTYDLFPYDAFIFYRDLTNIISLDRVFLK